VILGGRWRDERGFAAGERERARAPGLSPCVSTARYTDSINETSSTNTDTSSTNYSSTANDSSLDTKSKLKIK